jgi:hypothetical protein
MRSRRASHGSARPLNCTLCGLIRKRISGIEANVFARGERTLRLRGAAAAKAFYLMAGGKRRCVAIV